MSKALDSLLEIEATHEQDFYEAYIGYEINFEEMNGERYKTVKEALNTPTSQQVCKEIEKCLGNVKAKYEEPTDNVQTGMLYIKYHSKGSTWNRFKYHNNWIAFNHPHLITMIGKFYEGLYKNEPALD